MHTRATFFFASSLLVAMAACTATERSFIGAGGSGDGGSSSSGSSSSGGPMCTTAAECDDGDACTTDTCDAGTCAHDAVVIDDDDACTEDACDPLTGVSHTAVVIDDNDPCTADACDVKTGVSHTPIYEPAQFAITELSIGNPDYLVLTNRSTCPNSTAGLQILWDGSTGTDVTTTLPAEVVPPNGTIEITDDALAPAPEIYAGAAVSFDPSGGGAALLCNGACSAATVIDAVAFSIGAAAPALPTGVSFGPRALRGITSANQNAASFHRAAFGGAAPSFLASDWLVGEPCDVRNLKIVELNIGSTDYVVIHNPTICQIDLDGLTFLFDDSSNTDTNFALPAQSIDAGGTVRLTDNATLPIDIQVPNIPFSATRGGSALLCNGACNVAANVIDALSWAGSAMPTPLPAGVTFSPSPITGITQADENSRSFVRVAQGGVAPAFLRSDWSIGPLCTAQTRIRFSELNIGTPDYVRLENTGFCPINLGGLQILFDDSLSSDVTAVLPAQLLAAGTSVVVKESGTVMAGEINAGVSIPFSSTRGGAAILCVGPCAPASGSNVVDVVAFSTGAPFPTLPMGITFSAGLLGIDSATENTTSWIRAAYKGTNPAFLAGDWFVGAADP